MTTARVHFVGRADSSRWFYVAMSLLMLAVVTYGFSRTIGEGLIHTQRAHRFVALLSLHGAVFYVWMVLFVVQSALVRGRKLRLHRLLGWAGAADAVLVLVLGLWATFADPAPFALERIGLVSMAGFGVPVALAIVGASVRRTTGGWCWLAPRC